MKKNALIRMKEIVDFSSDTEQTIIRYILKQPESVIESTIHSLASKTFTSPATLLRLCRKLGFSGYKDFKLAVSYELALRKTSSEEEKKEITQMDSLSEIVEKITYKNIISLEHTQNLTDFATLEKSVDLITDCRTIVFFGMGSSFFVAKDAYLKFLRIGKPAIVNEDWHTQLLQARNMTKDDLGVIFSYSGQTVEMVECMKAMKENDSPMIAVTRYGVSPVSNLSTYNIYVAANESIFRSGAMSSRISQLNVVDILYTAYANRTFHHSLDQLSKTHIHKPGNP